MVPSGGAGASVSSLLCADGSISSHTAPKPCAVINESVPAFGHVSRHAYRHVYRHVIRHVIRYVFRHVFGQQWVYQLAYSSEAV